MKSKKLFRLLLFSVPLSAFLVMNLWGQVAYDSMMEMARSFDPGHEMKLPMGQWVGAIGLVAYGVPYLAVTFVRCQQSPRDRLLFGFVAVASSIAVLMIGNGAFELSSAFRYLAISDTVDAETFMENVGAAESSLAFGWRCVFGASMLFVLGALSATRGDRNSAGSRPPVVARAVATMSLVFLLLAAIWSVASFMSLQSLLSGPPVEPKQIASSINGVIRSMLVALPGIAGCGLVAALLAAQGSVPRHQEPRSTEV